MFYRSDRSLLLAAAVIGFLGCRDAPKPAPQRPAESPIPVTPVPTPKAANALDACLDRETAKAGLNQYGDPEGTMYAGGSPLFNEATGQSTTRQEYISRKHPEILAKCQ